MKKAVLSSSLNKRLISRLMSSRPVTETTKSFNLKGSNEFLSRSNDVFGELKSLEVAHESWITENNTYECIPKNKDSEEPQYVKPPKFVDQTVNKNWKSDSNAFFKKPMLPKARCSKKYATNKNHKKWIKYSLEDVPLSSNATNTSTALAFINELRNSKKSVNEISDMNEKLLFSKPKEKVFHSIFSSSNKFTPESPAANKNFKSIIKLDHLESEDD